MSNQAIITVINEKGWKAFYELSKDLTELSEMVGCNSVDELLQLTELDLSNRKLEILPTAVLALMSLKKLNVSHNLLSALPEDLGKLTQLTHLNVSHNSLTALPTSIGE